MEEFKKTVLKIWNDLKEGIRKLGDKIKEYFSTKERPKQVTSMADYLEQKKNSEPFYKAVKKNRKPWE